MRKLVALIAVVAVAISAAAALAATHATVWTAALSSGQEVPKQVVKNTAAHGQFKGTLTGSKLTWKLTFSKLTGPATAAHIHMAAKGKSGNVVVPLCGPCKSPVSGTATLPSGSGVPRRSEKQINERARRRSSRADGETPPRPGKFPPELSPRRQRRARDDDARRCRPTASLRPGPFATSCSAAGRCQYRCL